VSPWCSERKVHETRHWPTSHRGWLVVQKLRIHVEQPRNVYAPEVFSKRSISGTGLTTATSRSGAMTEACTIPRFDEPRAEWVLTMFMSERARVRMA
jgi:hypothetical protein